MNTNRKTAVIVGILFIIGTVSGILSGIFIAPITGDPTFPLNISASETQWIIGALLITLMGLSLAMMPVVLYPLLQQYNRVLALGAVLFRGAIEAISYAIMVICQLVLLTVSQIYTNGSVVGTSILKTLESIITSASEWTEMWGALPFSIGAVMIYAVFYQARLVPRWLSAWGLMGGVLYFATYVASMLSPLHTPPSIGSGIGMLLIPLAIQEMVFAVWLIAKGFNRSAVTGEPTKEMRRAVAVQPTGD